ncbi:4-hydroxy-2-oxoheptanedioate aldolase [Clostridium sediminicola]|uniref:HpcH/HpaI aldolase family protein n=1 Tax=Clostridium sediminicola TaxID=3114879 RepID=UPI0031F20FC0
MLRKDEKFNNKVKHLLKDGKKVVGGWLQSGSNITAEVMARSGFDFCIIDMEHGPGNIMTLISQLQGMNGYGATPLVRAPWNDFVAIKRILDAGVHGLLVPYVSTKEEAESAVKACKYPPAGVRGVAGSPRAEGFGYNIMNYMNHADDEVMLMTAVETPIAVENIEELVSVEGLDGIFIGPMDLATSMGHFCDPKHPEVQEAIAKIEKTVFASNKFLGTVAGSFEQAKVLYDKGYQFVIVMSDTVSLGKLAVKNVESFKEEYPNR